MAVKVQPPSAGSGQTSAPWPGGSSRQPRGRRQRTMTTTAQPLAAYEPRRYRLVVENPVGSGAAVLIGRNLAKNRNTPGTFPDSVPEGSRWKSDPFDPFPAWAKTSAGTAVIKIRQELVGDR